MDHDEYIRRVRSYIKTPTKETEQQLDDFCSLCTYISGQYDQDESFHRLNKHIEELEKDFKEAHRLFYMALPPSVFTMVSQHLKRCCYPTKGIARVIVRLSSSLCCSRCCFFSLLTNFPPTGREAVRQGPGQLPRAAEVARARLEREGAVPH